MKIGVPQETPTGERRVALTPESATRIHKLGYACMLQSGAGKASGFSDADYRAVGVHIVKGASAVWKNADIIIKVHPPTNQEIALCNADKTIISLFYPNENKPLLDSVTAKEINVIALDMVPRISRAQKMDVLSSMANIAGYRSVLEASTEFGRFFTGQITAAGTTPPARVLVIGAGVAGLAAIGTAVSLGAVVKAFDVRPEVSEQIESLGAEFVRLDFTDNTQDSSKTGGYAAPSSPEFRAKQLQRFRAEAPQTDIVITTALIPGQNAPKLWLKDMIQAMPTGSVIVDLAAERGGNTDLTVKNKKIVTKNGVTIIGYTDFASRMGAQAAAMYANNVYHMLDDLTPKRDGHLLHNLEDDVIRGATVSYRGVVMYPPPPLQTAAIAQAPPAPAVDKPTLAPATNNQSAGKAGWHQLMLLACGALAMAFLGVVAPPSFMQHLTVFVLACFVGYQVIWNVSHALHTPLMAVTNAISGIIVVGALLQIGSNNTWVVVLSMLSVLIATINIVGGFLVTRKMLAMFRKS